MRFILLFLLCLSFDVQGFVYECGFKVIDKVLVPEKGTLFKQLYIEDINISGETYKDGYRISIPLNEVSEKIMYKNIEFNTKEGVTSNVHDYRVAHHRKKSYFIFEFTAHTENGMAIESVEFSLETVAPKDLVNRTFANKSALSSGTWYKFGGKEEGVYSIEGSDLVNAGLALSSIDVSRLKVFSNGGGQLPYNNCEYRVDDLKELPLYTEGLEDFKFDLNDRILFYHNAQNQIVYDTLQNKLVYRNNAFEDSVFFFLNIDGTEGLRIMSANTYANFDNVVTDYDALIRFEQDLENLIGSGRNWYGDKFDIKTDRDYLFNLENYIPNSSATLSGSLISRSIKSESSFQISLNGNLLGSKKIGGVGPNYEDTFAIGVNFDYPFSSNNGSNQKVSLAYIKAASNSIGWLDYLEFNYLADLRVNSQPLIFQNTSALDKGIVEYRLKGCQATHMIWDVSNPFFTREVQFNIINGLAHFRTDSDSLHKFIAFEPSQTLAVKFIQEISNQNVHAYTPADLLIITPTKFISQAERLAEYRKETDGLSVQVVKLEDIYNEFSGGGKDITAIKDFLKMFYDRASSEEEIPKYALLFADGSYDNKNITFQGSYHIPTYQSENSLSPIGSYTTDDYIALLDDAEGESLSDLIDLGVGRIPINDIEQARDMVDKLISYYDERAYRNWRNEVVLVADDGQPNEGVTHMVHADQVDNVISNKYPNLNIDKIYLDAYEQIESAGGQRYPDAHRRLNEKMGQGSLILHYAGHGGELGWAHERVLGVPDIRAWSNQYNMPIMMTATCEFSRFDDHNRTAAGELVVMNPNGGAAGLFTTTRLVFGNDNAELANNFYNNLELNDNQSDLRLGDFVRKSKLLGPYSINTRNFSLLGDPSMKLSYPRNQVLTTSIPDTIRA
ncbi:MAG: type IX secretion system sortase PorU, partial [Flavobacteriales bacterium]|nr:type IX secretion system sortase PorU [Flavobacteriales bacterium]